MAYILIVDDEIAICKYLQQLLKNFGYATGFLFQPHHLLDRLAETKVDLILMDVNMPNIDGLSLLKLLKAQPQFDKIPVIMLTGQEDEQLIANCLDAGAQDFVVKPVKEKVLKSRIDTILTAQTNMEQLELLVKNRTHELEEANQRIRLNHVELKKFIHDLEHLNQTFQRFVPRQFLNRIESQELLQPGMFKEETFTILFADIRGYTKHVENMSPQENLEFLNEIFKFVVPPIDQYHGFVDKFIGDGIMAIFDRENSANDAISAAMDMQLTLNSYNKKRLELGKLTVQLGIGINTGPVMVGILGTSSHLNSTVVGDHVNLASRLEALTKRFHARILISHHTFAKIDAENYLIREIDTVRVRGRTKPVLIYEVFDIDPPHLRAKKLEIRDELFKGIVLYKSQLFPQAIEVFEHCIEKFPQDVVVLEYLKRCRYFERFPLKPDADWDGIVKDSDLLVDHQMRRKSERVLLTNTPAVLYQHGTEREYECHVRDISLTGISIFINFSVQDDDLFLVSVNLPSEITGQYTCHRILCSVVWSYPHSPTEILTIYLVGLEAIVMTNSAEELLKNSLRLQKMNDWLKLHLRRSPTNICIVELRESLTLLNLGDIKFNIGWLLEDKTYLGVILNLSKLEFLDSLSVGLIVSLYQMYLKRSRPFVICDLNILSRRVMTSTSLDKIIPIFDLEAAAIDFLRETNKS